MFAHCLYNIYSNSHLKFQISLMNLKKSGIRWSQPYQSPTLVLIHHSQKLNALLPLPVSLQINVLLFPSFPNSHHLLANFPGTRGPDTNE